MINVEWFLKKKIRISILLTIDEQTRKKILFFENYYHEEP